jgi:hypothetical protein
MLTLLEIKSLCLILSNSRNLASSSRSKGVSLKSELDIKYALLKNFAVIILDAVVTKLIKKFLD